MCGQGHMGRTETRLMVRREAGCMAGHSVENVWMRLVRDFGGCELREGLGQLHSTLFVMSNFCLGQGHEV